MRPDPILTRLDSLAHPHGYGHRCLDGQWYNPNAGSRTPCPTSEVLAAVRADVTRLAASVHDAAHDDAAAAAVAEGMTGLVLAELPEDSRAGWLLSARMAMEALAQHLDRDPVREARAAAVAARLAAARVSGAGA